MYVNRTDGELLLAAPCAATCATTAIYIVAMTTTNAQAADVKPIANWKSAGKRSAGSTAVVGVVVVLSTSLVDDSVAKGLRTWSFGDFEDIETRLDAGSTCTAQKGHWRSARKFCLQCRNENLNLARRPSSLCSCNSCIERSGQPRGVVGAVVECGWLAEVVAQGGEALGAAAARAKLAAVPARRGEGMRERAGCAPCGAVRQRGGKREFRTLWPMDGLMVEVT